MNSILITILLLSTIALSYSKSDKMDWFQLRVAGSRPDSREGAAFFTRKTGDIVLFGGYQENTAINIGLQNVFFQ